MSEFTYQFCEGEIRVEMPFAVQRYFQMLFDDVRPSGGPSGVVIKDSDINRFKLARLKAASFGITVLKAEVERLSEMADDLDRVTRAIEIDSRDLNLSKNASQAYIKKCRSFDLLRQAHEEIYLNLESEFNNGLRLGDEWRSKVRWVAECHRIESLFVTISELFDFSNSPMAELMLDNQRDELLRVHKSIGERFKLDFKALKSLAGVEWCRESFHDTSMLMHYICSDVDILSHQD
ncbi:MULTISPECIES: hypothetical protein [Pseudomonas]|uniref:hypothetical protein n=1 Tax=Pseudomonas TaxID=286 RepID=UPI0008637859|nr:MULTISPECIES: hypothetical protein [Pseudomonas]MDD1989921.1 hypothetical protein [Pseudomonas putida]QOH70605.1 hypothetical protein IGB31_24185 [Pseudomonas putida]